MRRGKTFFNPVDLFSHSTSIPVGFLFVLFYISRILFLFFLGAFLSFQKNRGQGSAVLCEGFSARIPQRVGLEAQAILNKKLDSWALSSIILIAYWFLARLLKKYFDWNNFFFFCAYIFKFVFISDMLSNKSSIFYCFLNFLSHGFIKGGALISVEANCAWTEEIVVGPWKRQRQRWITEARPGCDMEARRQCRNCVVSTEPFSCVSDVLVYLSRDVEDTWN